MKIKNKGSRGQRGSRIALRDTSTYKTAVRVWDGRSAQYKPMRQRMSRSKPMLCKTPTSGAGTSPVTHMQENATGPSPQIIPKNQLQHDEQSDREVKTRNI